MNLNHGRAASDAAAVYLWISRAPNHPDTGLPVTPITGTAYTVLDSFVCLHMYIFFFQILASSESGLSNHYCSLFCTNIYVYVCTNYTQHHLLPLVHSHVHTLTLTHPLHEHQYRCSDITAVRPECVPEGYERVEGGNVNTEEHPLILVVKRDPLGSPITQVCVCSYVCMCIHTLCMYECVQSVLMCIQRLSMRVNMHKVHMHIFVCVCVCV
jgi:hypothetical protein